MMKKNKFYLFALAALMFTPGVINNVVTANATESEEVTISPELQEKLQWVYDNLTLNFVNVKENISKSFIDVIHEAGYNEILDITMNKDIEILKTVDYLFIDNFGEE